MTALITTLTIASVLYIGFRGVGRDPALVNAKTAAAAFAGLLAVALVS